MTVNQPRNRRRTQSRGFLDGPDVAALFRAARRAAPASETPRPIPERAASPMLNM
ncbi:MAG TPA: hypothetical protein VLG93_04760 [Sulfuricaulis sp.]|nr:hypothetical protein [Sulfuricaulis sp.]